ncbi:MAG: hypothetical protein GX639_03055 [Fibrobacter sp.]|nr:hypothetical protein [Fibrobacter sp.]
MKRAVVTLLVLFVLGIGGYFGYTFYKIKTSALEKARKAELEGRIQNAFDHYIDALRFISPDMPLPDLNKSKVVDSKIWKSDLVRYTSWLLDTSKKTVTFDSVYRKIIGYQDTYSHSENKIINLTNAALSGDAFDNEWKETFYASTAPWDESHKELSSYAYSKKGSFLRLSADKGFTYNISIINLKTGIRTSFTVYSEGKTTSLIFPGDYIIICKSIVEYSKGQKWVSPSTITPITIPDSSSLVKGMLITKVSRTK